MPPKTGDGEGEADALADALAPSLALGDALAETDSLAEAEALVRGPGDTLVGSPRMAENLYLKIRNESGAQIDKGKLVVAVGFSVGEARVLVALADKDDPTKRPAVAITTENVADDGDAVL